jgi:hypothetical protein
LSGLQRVPAAGGTPPKSAQPESKPQQQEESGVLGSIKRLFK